ncbi:MAG: hypothetical protein ACPGJS_22260 [Flammeovirgaceae bacterium]
MNKYLIFLLFAFASCGRENRSEPFLEDSLWTRNIENPIMSAGFKAIDGYTAISVSDPSVLFDEEDNIWKMWVAIGWFEGEQFKTGIKYAESNDGTSWSIHPDICLQPSTVSSSWDYTSVETPMVVKVENNPSDKKYLLWYSGGNITINPLGEDYPRFQIGLAYSADGITFNKISESESPYQQEGLVFKVEDAFPSFPSVKTGIVADPSVIYENGVFKMWFTSIGLTINDEDVDGGVAYAESVDGINWTASAQNPLQSLKRISEDFVAQPAVVYDAQSSQYEMWFSADYESELEEVGMNGTIGFWYANSADGLNWTVSRDDDRDFKYAKNIQSEAFGLTVGCFPTYKNDSLILYYGALSSGQSFSGNPWPYVHVINSAIKENQ